MKHKTHRDFWTCYHELPKRLQRLADDCFAQLKADPRHPGLNFKKVGKLWSVRVGRDYRALAIPGAEGLVWFWIGPHDEYERIIGIS